MFRLNPSFVLTQYPEYGFGRLLLTSGKGFPIETNSNLYFSAGMLKAQANHLFFNRLKLCRGVECARR